MMSSEPSSTNLGDFTPALGKPWLTPLYDTAIRLLTSEARWRKALICHAELQTGDRLIDVGSGTGSLLMGLHNAGPAADLLGVEPDPGVLKIAQQKTATKAPSIRWHNGFLDSLQLADGLRPNKIVSSLLFHQVPTDLKRQMIEQIRSLLEPEGMFLIADYMRQETPLMRKLFRATVQRLDGFSDTQPNADGIMEQLITANFMKSEKLATFNTATGTISLWRGFKARNSK